MPKDLLFICIVREKIVKITNDLYKVKKGWRRELGRKSDGCRAGGKSGRTPSLFCREPAGHLPSNRIGILPSNLLSFLSYSILILYLLFKLIYFYIVLLSRDTHRMNTQKKKKIINIGIITEELEYTNIV